MIPFVLFHSFDVFTVILVTLAILKLPVINRPRRSRACSSTSVNESETETIQKKQQQVNSKDRDATEVHTRKNNYPQNTGGKRLPKYGSQSETTTDSCL